MSQFIASAERFVHACIGIKRWVSVFCLAGFMGWASRIDAAQSYVQINGYARSFSYTYVDVAPAGGDPVYAPVWEDAWGVVPDPGGIRRFGATAAGCVTTSNGSDSMGMVTDLPTGVLRIAGRAARRVEAYNEFRGEWEARDGHLQMLSTYADWLMFDGPFAGIDTIPVTVRVHVKGFMTAPTHADIPSQLIFAVDASFSDSGSSVFYQTWQRNPGDERLDIDETNTAVIWTGPEGFEFRPMLEGFLSDTCQGSLRIVSLEIEPPEGYRIISSSGVFLSQPVPIDGEKLTPLITWTDPAPMMYGTPLSGTQLNATANVDGTFTYTPAPGRILEPGEGQTLTATFVPADLENYRSVVTSVHVDVFSNPYIGEGWVFRKLKEYRADGKFPRSGLVRAGSVAYGTTTAGGDDSSNGTLYQLDLESGAVEILHRFNYPAGAYPTEANLILVEGKLYGTTPAGGSGFRGTLFRFDPATRTHAVLHEFTGPDGEDPRGSLFEFEGSLYGTAFSGGSHGKGTIFRLQLASGAFEVLHSFSGPDGEFPQAGFAAIGGFLYGTTRTTFFRLDPAQGTVGEVVDLGYAYPWSDPLVVEGKLYFTGYNSQSLYEYEPSTHALTQIGLGGSPQGRLLEYQGRIYGTTTPISMGSSGTIFAFDPATRALSTEYSFPDTQNSSVFGGLIEYQGKFLGIIYGDRPLDFGGVYSFDPATRTSAILHRFPNTEGLGPMADLAPFGDHLYGTTFSGGTRDCGTLFRIDPATGEFQLLDSFLGQWFGDGEGPRGRLTEHDGRLYGTTWAGGELFFNTGSIFSLDPVTGEHETVHEFKSLDGTAPMSGLVEWSGSLYGTTVNGGGADRGTLFRFEPGSRALTTLHTFSGPDGASPIARLLVVDGNLIGATSRGGAAEVGTIFSFDPATGDFRTLHSFAGTDGAHPDSELLVVGDVLFGTASGGGPNDLGAIFQFDLQSSDYSVLHYFSGGDGAWPESSLTVLGEDLFGTTQGGGFHDLGAVYRFRPGQPGVNVVHHFTSSDGAYTISGLVASGGKLFGGASRGGTDNCGTLFVLEKPLVPVMTISGLSPTSLTSNGLPHTVTILGNYFEPSTVVYWNGSPRVTTFVSSELVTVEIPDAEIADVTDIQTVLVRVGRSSGPESNAAALVILPADANVGPFQSAVAAPGGTASVAVGASDTESPGVAATARNSGGESLAVVAAVLESPPVTGSAFQVADGEFVDLQITGADANDVAVAQFYYPIGTPNEDSLELTFLKDGNWVAVRSSGGATPVKNTTDNLDLSISGGRFTVTFDHTSTPAITDLNGTVFALVDTNPQFISLTGPASALALGAPATLSVRIGVVGNPLGARVAFDWDDGTTASVAPSAEGGANATKTYAAPGVYRVGIRVTDENGRVSAASFEYVVVYSSNAGDVTGGGWLKSPAGALVSNPQPGGKVGFSFNAKYLKGASAPSGEIEVQMAGLKFQSTQYQWLVVAGAKAQIRGTGRVNDAGSYGFLLTAADGQLSGSDSGGVDRIRIKIWDQTTGSVVYDNVPGDSDDIDAAAPAPIDGGSVVIHKAR